MVIEGRLVEDGPAVRVETDGPRITRIEEIDSAARRMDWIAPGLIDMQVNDFGGHDANALDVSPTTITDLVHNARPMAPTGSKTPARRSAASRTSGHVSFSSRNVSAT
jgi:hypothetical protein